MQYIQWLLKVSRPRFWFYVFGPFLVGLAAAGIGNLETVRPIVLIISAIYFTFPANLYIYGTNDIYDYETDIKNPKKKSFEQVVAIDQQERLALLISLTNIPFIAYMIYFSNIHINALYALLAFLFFSLTYSAPPIRAKTKPFLDSLFNILYIFPGVFAYALVTRTLPPIELLAAATLWCMAMHAYSAAPDIAADKKAGLRTIATVLGLRGTVLFCSLCYAAAGALSFPALGLLSAALSVVYLVLMLLSYRRNSRSGVFELYKLFPYVNIMCGFALFVLALVTNN